MSCSACEGLGEPVKAPAEAGFGLFYKLFVPVAQ